MKASQKNGLISRFAIGAKEGALCLMSTFQRSSKSVCRTVITIPMTSWPLKFESQMLMRRRFVPILVDY